jgi:hypothetical protein
MDNIEQRILDFLIMSFWFCLKRTFIIFIIIPLTLCFLCKERIYEIPVRYPVVGVVKMGYLKVRSFKSSILEKISDVAKRAPIEEAMGYQKEDLKVVLEAKFLSERGRNKNMMDKGPFITSINFPEMSNLIIITAEGEGKDGTRKTVMEVINFLKNEFDFNKEKFIAAVKARVDTLEKDRRKILSTLKKLDKVEREFGFTPFLAKQRNELVLHETRLRYMILDINSQLDPSSVQDFEIISINTSVYAVTKRKLIYFSLVFVVGLFISFLILTVVSIFHYRYVPPPLPKNIIIKELRC